MHEGEEVVGEDLINNHCFQMLLKSGADPNIVMEDKRTPLHIASEAGNTEVIKLLLENDADILATDQVRL